MSSNVLWVLLFAFIVLLFAFGIWGTLGIILLMLVVAGLISAINEQ